MIDYQRLAGGGINHKADSRGWHPVVNGNMSQTLVHQFFAGANIQRKSIRYTKKF